jgi:hypothetical protein
VYGWDRRGAGLSGQERPADEEGKDNLRITLLQAIFYVVLSAAGWLMVMWPVMALVRACLAAAGE